jgi:hypothetical protein
VRVGECGGRYRGRVSMAGSCGGGGGRCVKADG